MKTNRLAIFRGKYLYRLYNMRDFLSQLGYGI